jgi:GTP-binding protein
VFSVNHVVERIMSMVDGVCLVVDATDGVMTQTKFVLGKALARGLRPVVVVNKIDRPTARLGEVENEIFDLFALLNATDDQMDFPIVYACAREAWATLDPKKPSNNMADLFKTIVSHVPHPPVTLDKPFSMLITQIDSDPFVGKLLQGRIFTGKVRMGDRLKALDEQGKLIEEVKVTRVQTRRGMDKVIVDEAEAGNIISLAGFSKASINSTLCALSVNESIPSIPIDPPSLSMVFSANDGPLASGKTNMDAIKQRLLKEAETNVSLAVSEATGGVEVRGRGELQLGVLLETMRREGFELCVSAPKVVMKQEGGKTVEPLEEVVIDVGQDYTGQIIEKMSLRKGELLDFQQTDDGKARLSFRVPMRGLLGYRSELTYDTRGTAVLNSTHHSYVPHMGEVDKQKKGALISQSEGVTTTFALDEMQNRGSLFVQVGEKVYQGQVIGENIREGNLDVNPCKLKELSNVRQVQKEEKSKVRNIVAMSLEELIAYVRDDEMIEVTPEAIRLRKKILDAQQRKREDRIGKNKLELEAKK